MYRSCSPVSVITTSPSSTASEPIEEAITDLRNLLPDKIAQAVAANGTPAVDPIEILFCIAAIIQAQIFEDEKCSDDVKSQFPVFQVEVELSPEYGGVVASVSEAVLNHETANDQELREKIVKGVVPTIDTILRFIRYLFLRAKYTPECNIIALVYVNRLSSAASLPLTMSNWRGVWLAAISLAQKVWDDQPLRTSQFSEILTNIPRSRLRDLESTLLQQISFTTYVKPELYFKYHYELDLLMLDITGSQFTNLST